MIVVELNAAGVWTADDAMTFFPGIEACRILTVAAFRQRYAELLWQLFLKMNNLLS